MKLIISIAEEKPKACIVAIYVTVAIASSGWDAIAVNERDKIEIQA